MITIDRIDKVDIVTFNVEKIDALITDDLRSELNDLFKKGNLKVVIDLKGIHYIDSTGFSCLLSVLKTARNNFSVLKLANPEPSVMQVFTTLHLQTVFDISNDLDACLRSI